MSPLKAIREKCLDCCCGSASEVKLCPSKGCALWPFRSGHNPNRAGIGGSPLLKEKANSANDSSPQNAKEEV